MLESFAALRLHPDEQRYFADEIRVLRRDEGQEQEKAIAALELNLKQVAGRLSRLTDAYIDRVLDQDSFEERKAALLSERCTLDDSLAAWRLGKRNPAEELQQILERADTAYLAQNKELSGKSAILSIRLPRTGLSSTKALQSRWILRLT